MYKKLKDHKFLHGEIHVQRPENKAWIFHNHHFHFIGRWPLYERAISNDCNEECIWISKIEEPQ